MSATTFSTVKVGEWDAVLARPYLERQLLVKCVCGAWVRESVLGRHGTQTRGTAVVDCQGNEVKP